MREEEPISTEITPEEILAQYNGCQCIPENQDEGENLIKVEEA